MNSSIKTTCFGYPKIGENRELKKLLEHYWSGKITKQTFLNETDALKFKLLQKQQHAGIDLITSNDFTLYDFMLDLSVMFGVIPERFAGITDELALYFAMARGTDSAAACEMTKWFDTNYHYIVPEINGKFTLGNNRPLRSYQEAKETLGIETTPQLVGPFTFLKLAKGYNPNQFHTLLLELAQCYNHVLKELEANGVQAVQLDEPAFVLDLSDDEITALLDAYKIVTQGLSSLKTQVQTYYESMTAYEKIVFNLPVDAIGLDFVSQNDNLTAIKTHGFPKNKQLIAGVIAGRDVWKTNYETTTTLVKALVNLTGDAHLVIANASPLFHLPVSLEPEKAHLNENLLPLLSFANERLEELTTLKGIINNNTRIPVQHLAAIQALFKNQTVQDNVAAINEADIGRIETFAFRSKKQAALLNLPLFPTTSIGSYPQTVAVRQARADFKKGVISKEAYDIFLQQEIAKVITLQEEIGLDVLVHGEFERTDMVEHFGQRLEGFAFTKNGWVQSYGSRCVRPPIIYADVSRPAQMTVDEIVYAQSLTKKPVKGMLTGPVTILNWSFFRKDISKKEIAFQIALALKEEVMDLEQAGIQIIQIDEAAFREGMPLRKAKQADYLDWAVNAFKLTNEDVNPETQIHTHMCYSEFNEILARHC